MSGESSMGMSSSASMEGIGGDIGGFTGDRGCGERCGAGDLAGAAGADGFNVPSPYHDPKPQQWPVELGSLQSEGRGDGHAGLLFRPGDSSNVVGARVGTFLWGPDAPRNS